MSDEHAHHYTFLFLLINFLRKKNHEIADMIVTPKAQITKTKMDMIKSSKKNVFLLLNNFTCARIYRFVLRNIEKKVLLRNYCLPYPNFWENFFGACRCSFWSRIVRIGLYSYSNSRSYGTRLYRAPTLLSIVRAEYRRSLIVV